MAVEEGRVVCRLLFDRAAMKRDKRLTRTVTAILIAAAIAGVALSIPFFRSVSRARRVLQAEKDRSIRLERLEIRSRAVSPAPNTRARLWLGPAEVRDAAVFEGNVYTATSGGLIEYAPDGRLLNRWTPTEGFPSLDITSLAVQGKTLFVGTASEGWLRYENSEWTQFLPADAPLRSVHALLATRQGSLFIGTADGILRFNGKDYERFYPGRMKKTTVTCLAGDALNLRIGTFNSGLYVFEKGELRQYGTEQGFNDSLVTDIEVDGAAVYVATPSGITRAEDGKFAPVMKNTFVQSIRIHGKDLWAATRGHGLVRVPTTAALRRPESYAPAAPEVGNRGALLREIGNSLVVFAPGKALRLAANGKWQTWSEPVSPLNDSNITSLLHTPDGNLWIGYFDRGLDVVNPDFQPVRHYEDDVFFCINYLSRDNAGRTYVSTANGLVVMRPDGTHRVLREADGLLSDRVMQAVPLDPDGHRVAIATAQGFTLMEDGALKSLYAFHGLVNNHVYSIAARGDQIYVGTLGGISSINNMQVVSSWTQMDSGLRRNWVNALLALDNRLLVGTYGSGIQARSETGDWTGFDPLPENFEVNPNAFFYDGRYVFCGTLDRGVYVYDTQRNKWKQILQGLPGPNATAFARGGSTLYVATTRGLLQISYDDINTMPDLH